MRPSPHLAYAGLVAASLLAAGPATAVPVTLDGPRFDIVYDDAELFFGLGTASLIDDSFTLSIISGGAVNVGGGGPTSQVAYLYGTFTIIPEAGRIADSVRMTVDGEFSDPSPDFDTLYFEALFSDNYYLDKRNELSSGAGPLPSGLEIFPNYDGFPRPENRVDFIAYFTAPNSDPLIATTATLSRFTFDIVVTPIPATAALLAAGLAVLGAAARRHGRNLR